MLTKVMVFMLTKVMVFMLNKVVMYTLFNRVRVRRIGDDAPLQTE